MLPGRCERDLDIQDRRRAAAVALVGERSIDLPGHLDRFAYVTALGRTQRVETFAILDDALSAVAASAHDHGRHVSLGDLDVLAAGSDARRIVIRHTARGPTVTHRGSGTPDEAIESRSRQIIRAHHARQRGADYRYGDVYLLLTQRPTGLMEFEWFPDLVALTRRLVALVRVDDRFVGLWRPSRAPEAVAVEFTSAVVGGSLGGGPE